LVKLLKESGYFLLKVKEDKKTIEMPIFSKVSTKELSVLCNQLYLMINAGIPISETLYTISSVEKKPIIKKKLLSIYNDVIKGKELYKAMQDNKDIFPAFFIQMVHLGEQAGNLDKVLKNLYEYYESESKIYNKIKSSMTYPIMVFITSITVILFLMIKVVPEFIDTLNSLGGQLPAITGIMLFICSFIKEYSVIILFLFAMLGIFLTNYFKTDNGKIKIDSLKFKIPFVKIIYEKVVLSKFSRSMSTLLNSGFNIINSLELSSDVSDNIIFKKRIEGCLDYIKKGESLSSALSNVGIKNSLFISLVRTGEETGEIEKVLNKTADFFESDVEELLKRIVSLIEPVMVIIMALIIGTFIMSIMLPVLSIMDSIK